MTLVTRQGVLKRQHLRYIEFIEFYRQKSVFLTLISFLSRLLSDFVSRADRPCLLSNISTHETQRLGHLFTQEPIIVPVLTPKSLKPLHLLASQDITPPMNLSSPVIIPVLTLKSISLPHPETVVIIDYYTTLHEPVLPRYCTSTYPQIALAPSPHDSRHHRLFTPLPPFHSLSPQVKSNVCTFPAI